MLNEIIMNILTHLLRTLYSIKKSCQGYKVCYKSYHCVCPQKVKLLFENMNNDF